MPLHKCEHHECDKKTKARFCEDHLPRCKKCNKKCRKFEDPNDTVCFRHSDYLKEKTRIRVAKYKAAKRERKIMRAELANIIKPIVDDYEEYYRDLLKENEIEFVWQEFVMWLRLNYQPVYDLFDKLGAACVAIDGLSGDELREYYAKMGDELRSDLERYVSSCEALKD